MTPAEIAEIASDRNRTIAELRRVLRARSGRAWSVSGGRGTAWGWITIQSPPARRVGWGYMPDDDRAELARLLGFDRPVHNQGETIPASTADRRFYLGRAHGETATARPAAYWD